MVETTLEENVTAVQRIDLRGLSEADRVKHLRAYPPPPPDFWYRDQGACLPPSACMVFGASRKFFVIWIHCFFIFCLSASLI
jgi:hypothetical protein